MKKMISLYCTGEANFITFSFNIYIYICDGKLIYGDNWCSNYYYFLKKIGINLFLKNSLKSFLN